MKIAALLTARAGSKSVLNKNILQHRQMPLYLHNIYHAINSEYINNVYISTDIKQIHNEYNQNIKYSEEEQLKKIKLIERPIYLCQDTSLHYDTIIHGLNYMEQEIGPLDILVVLLGNTPHAYTEDLDTAINNFINNFDNFDSCMSVGKFNMFNPWRSFEILSNGNCTPILDYKITNRTNVNDKNAFNDTYFFTGSFWIIKRQTLFDNNGSSVYTYLGNRIMPYVQVEGCQEIDAPWQIKTL